MKKDIILVCSFIIILFSCRGREKSNESSQELMSARTLGLAYLEEFKLEEAEKEFLKFIDLAPEDKFGYANLGLTYLRMGKYPEAEKNLLQAIGIDSVDADVRLILSTVYKMNDEPEKSVAGLKKALSFAPDHVKVLYEISEIYALNQDKESADIRKYYLQRLIEAAPDNLVPRLSYTDMLIRSGEMDSAMEQMEIIRKQFPEFPREATEYYDSAIQDISENDTGNAILQFTIFHNYLKVTAPYQAGMMNLKGPGGSLIGFPLITFDRQSSPTLPTGESILDGLRFTEVSEVAGLVTVAGGSSGFPEYSLVEAADYDGDGDIDLYAGSYDPQKSTFRHWLFSNNSGRFTDMAEQAGLTHTGIEKSAAFGDYDNDGFLDLYIIREAGDLLYRNTGDGKFENVTRTANTGGLTEARKALFLDADHDGDLDLFLACSKKNLLFRNNGDGTFDELGEKMELAGEISISSDAVFGDFDDDGDIDLIVANENAGNILHSNQRQGVFRDITYESGLQSQGGSTSVAASDYNNDGFMDLFVGSSDGSCLLYTNSGNGKFEVDRDAADNFRTMKNVRIHDAEFLDFDNDGFTDLLISCVGPGEKARSLFLYHNDGKGRFDDVSEMLQDAAGAGRDIAIFDYNDDGDSDIAVSKPGGGLALLRNDGGNSNHYVKIRLVGLRAGSAKNNHFGIGARVEIRAGELYQAMVVSKPDLLFGIGNRSMADVIRITWTNGVPQNIFYPVADQALIEAQTLKGSCPFLYAWDGEKYSFVKDILWRSGLGMPLGIMGGTTAYAFADASDDYLKIPGESMKPHSGKYSVQVTSELWETIYLDKLKLVAVDHPDSTDIFVEEQFSPPPFPGLNIFHVEKKITPVSAVDSYGRDVLHFISEKDDKYLSGYRSCKYQGITEVKYIVIDPGNADAGGILYLFLNGWIFPTDASINVALSQSENIQVQPPVIQVVNKEGRWETIADNTGFPMGKDKTVIVDLSGKFLSKDHRIRILTNMDIYWDHIFLSGELTGIPVVTSEMNPTSADLHYRGFSEGFRKGGRYGPHWFDYSKVSRVVKWRDLAGNYTRYGDVLPLLTSSDNRYIISNAGDEVTIEFDASALPHLKKGWKRDFLINSVGWVKDGDLNTAFGNTVSPLPFHGMKSYPPSPDDKYPDTQELKRYNQEYNTRVITGEQYLNALKMKDIALK